MVCIRQTCDVITRCPLACGEKKRKKRKEETKHALFPLLATCCKCSFLLLLLPACRGRGKCLPLGPTGFPRVLEILGNAWISMLEFLKERIVSELERVLLTWLRRSFRWRRWMSYMVIKRSIKRMFSFNFDASLLFEKDQGFAYVHYHLLSFDFWCGGGQYSL